MKKKQIQANKVLREENQRAVKNSRRISAYVTALNDCGHMNDKCASRLRGWCEFQ